MNEKKEKGPLLLRASLNVLSKIGESFLNQRKHYDYFIKEFKKLSQKVEKNPHLNFISLLQAYKIIKDVLDNKISYFYNNRNRLWFKKFFVEKELYEMIKQDIEFYYKKYPNIKLTLTKDGTMVYDNYQPNQFNILLLTVHGGTWVPKSVAELMSISKSKIHVEEDIGTDLIYGPLVLEKGGLWINSKQSRFVCDFNRAPERAIYTNDSEARIKNIWKKDMSQKNKQRIMKSYKRFYHLLNTLIETHRFNIVFDGHSMVNEPQRPDLSFGIKYVPKFYLPIVEKMRKNISKRLNKKVELNRPFGGGYILKHLSNQFLDIFIFSMEINKKIYMGKKHLKIKKRNMWQLSKAIEKIFEF